MFKSIVKAAKKKISSILNRSAAQGQNHNPISPVNSVNNNSQPNPFTSIVSNASTNDSGSPENLARMRAEYDRRQTQGNPDEPVYHNIEEDNYNNVEEGNYNNVDALTNDSGSEENLARMRAEYDEKHSSSKDEESNYNNIEEDNYNNIDALTSGTGNSSLNTRETFGTERGVPESTESYRPLGLGKDSRYKGLQHYNAEKSQLPSGPSGKEEEVKSSKNDDKEVIYHNLDEALAQSRANMNNQ